MVMSHECNPSVQPRILFILDKKEIKSDLKQMSEQWSTYVMMHVIIVVITINTECYNNAF